jgi:pimeloyl-ACP methyl ester carboxylesterase
MARVDRLQRTELEAAVGQAPPSPIGRSIGPSQTPDEVRALARLGFAELRGASGGIGAIHGAIAGRVFAAVGRSSVVVRLAHESIANRVCAGIGSGFSRVGQLADEALGRSGRRAPRALSPTALGGGLLGVLDGLIGDQLERDQSDLQEPMAVRVDGRVVDCDRPAVALSFPGATGRLAVFVHGLMGTEFPWRWFAGESGETYGTRLSRDAGFTPVYIRYNSGRHVSENGRSLAELLERLVAAWPIEVEQVALIGHSMGGLVARSACWYASEDGGAWVRHVRHTVSLGTPHMGAPLARAVHHASAGLDRWPETRPIAHFLRRRSGGIRDLRQGSLVDEDWNDCDPDSLEAVACKEIPLLEGVTHCFVSATIMRNERHPLSRLVGDCLVLQPSASGYSRTRRIPFEAEYGVHVGPADHLALLNHPAVYERLREWLSSDPVRIPAG